jgi:hypothetical protein
MRQFSAWVLQGCRFFSQRLIQKAGVTDKEFRAAGAEPRKKSAFANWRDKVVY